MKPFSAIAIFFIIWWLVLFITLPFGVRSAHENGEAVEPGNEPGAPIKTHLKMKFLATTVIAMSVFALVYLLYTGHLVSLADLGFIGPKLEGP